jgi:hypothetical protein
MLADFILEMPIPMMALSVVLCVFCWRRLGDRNRIHAFLQSRHLGDSANAVSTMTEAYPPAFAPGEKLGWVDRTERKLLGWSIEKAKQGAPGSWKASFFGVLILAADAQVLRVTRRFGIIAIIAYSVSYARNDPTGAWILYAVVALPLIPMLVILMVGWDELWRRRQAVLLLPLSRREFLNVRWAFLALMFGVGFYTVASQLAVSLIAHAFWIESVDGESVNQFRGWLWLNWFLLATVAPAIAGLAMTATFDPLSAPWAVLITLLACLGISIVVGVFYGLPPGSLYACLAAGVASVWMWAISRLRRCTLSGDVHV